VLSYQKQAKLMNDSLNAVVRFNDSFVSKNLDEFASRPLAALPIMLKDNILLE
jgi:hypothetical protein